MTQRIAFESEKKRSLETARTRLLIGGALMTAAFVAVGLRLVDLAAFSTVETLRGHAAREVAAPEQPRRAEIVDRNGVLLASNLETASLYANPHRIPDPAQAARRIVGVLQDLSEPELAARLASDRSFVWVKRNLTPRQEYEVNRLGIPGLDFQQEERRVYPLGRLAGHVVGFTGIDNEGLAGVEQSFDDALTTTGAPLALSLDMRVQQIMRQELADQIEKFKAIGGGGIVLDVNTGEILSLVSLPDFDPNVPGKADPDTRFNRITLGVYELGSVFKIFNHAIALETGVATMNSRYDATKGIRVGRFTISDYHPENRWLSVPEIFRYSSNIGSARMALDFGGQVQRKFLTDLGLLRRAALELPEQALPIYPATWREVNTMTISFGHGIAVSPLHLANGVSAVVNGGILRPATLIRQPAGAAPAGERVLSEQTSDEMRRLLHLVVQEGTGRNAAVPGYLVGGKTGTAEKQVNGQYVRKALISSFVGVFPINAPRFVVIAMLDEPKGIKESYGYATGGWTAAPVISRVIARMAPLYGIEPIDENAPEVQRALMVNLNAQPATGSPSGAPR